MTDILLEIKHKWFKSQEINTKINIKSINHGTFQGPRNENENGGW